MSRDPLIESGKIARSIWEIGRAAFIQSLESRVHHNGRLYLERELEQLHPGNRNIKAKIRQQLQDFATGIYFCTLDAIAGVYRELLLSSCLPAATWPGCKKVLMSSPSPQTVMPGNFLNHGPTGTSGSVRSQFATTQVIGGNVAAADTVKANDRGGVAEDCGAELRHGYSP